MQLALSFSLPLLLQHSLSLISLSPPSSLSLPSFLPGFPSDYSSGAKFLTKHHKLTLPDYVQGDGSSFLSSCSANSVVLSPIRAPSQLLTGKIISNAPDLQPKLATPSEEALVRYLSITVVNISLAPGVGIRGSGVGDDSDRAIRVARLNRCEQHHQW